MMNQLTDASENVNKTMIDEKPTSIAALEWKARTCFVKFLLLAQMSMMYHSINSRRIVIKRRYNQS
jgi:hypothetical protein